MDKYPLKMRHVYPEALILIDQAYLICPSCHCNVSIPPSKSTVFGFGLMWSAEAILTLQEGRIEAKCDMCGLVINMARLVTDKEELELSNKRR